MNHGLQIFKDHSQTYYDRGLIDSKYASLKAIIYFNIYLNLDSILLKFHSVLCLFNNSQPIIINSGGSETSDTM